VKRRELFKLLGAAAAWPLAARAQQPQAPMPVIGYLYAGSPDSSASLLRAFRQGLNEGGYFEGQNVAIEFRAAYNEFERLPDLAADLVRRRVAAIVAPGSVAAALAAKTATATIPVVFGIGTDPVQAGLVSSLNRPGGNVTGVSYMQGELAAKQVGLLHELLPEATRFAVLANPNNPLVNDSIVADSRAAVSSLGGHIEVLSASSNSGIDTAFANLIGQRCQALLVSPGPLFSNRRIHIAMLAMRYAMPAMYYDREFTEIGGLISYGTSLVDQYRQTGIYTARVLRGERPTDLPVQRATKFELVINVQTAKALGLTIPPTLLARADEVIE
jgi:putative ABC transport system substrate-binding protein